MEGTEKKAGNKSGKRCSDNSKGECAVKTKKVHTVGWGGETGGDNNVTKATAEERRKRVLGEEGRTHNARKGRTGEKLTILYSAQRLAQRLRLLLHRPAPSSSYFPWQRGI